MNVLGTLHLLEAVRKAGLDGPLPAERYELAQWLTIRANIDYHCLHGMAHFLDTQ